MSYCESLVIRRELGDRLGVAGSLEGLAAAERAQGDPEQAVRMLGAAAALREAIGSPLPPGARPAYDEQVAALRASLGEAAYCAAWGAGRALTWERAAAKALGEPEIDRPAEDDYRLRPFLEFVEGRVV
jgi:hypothetical protein